MANFLLVVDPDPERRDHCLRQAGTALHPVPGLVAGEADLGVGRVIWAVGARAQVSTTTSPAWSAVLLGELITESGSRLSAADYLTAQAPTLGAQAACDGFHLGIIGSREGKVSVAADLLGLFPVYYWSSGHVLLVASSPLLLRAHPLFTVELDARGLAGVLMMNGLAVGRTLYRGVRRLTPGCRLVWNGTAPAAEQPQFLAPMSAEYYELPLDIQADVVHEALAGLFPRLAPAGEPLGFVMSGGMDSRMLAGYLKGRGPEVTALTWGLPSDVEMRCASRVAAALGFRHLRRPRAREDLVERARESVRLEGLAAGFSSPNGLAGYQTLCQLPARTLSGHTLDYVLVTLSGGWRTPRDNSYPGWKQLFGNANAWGWNPDQVRRLVRPEVLGLGLEEAQSDLADEYASLGDRGVHRMRRFLLRNRGRFHVGGALWRHSFATWPVTPILDRELHRVAGGMPVNVIVRRLLQRTLIIEKFPDLARLPFDSNGFEELPLLPRTLQILSLAVRRRLRRGFPFMTHRGRASAPSYDFNGTRWGVLRAEADRSRGSASRVLQRTTLDELLPRAGVKVRFDDPVPQGGRYRLLTGVLLWLEEHL